VTSSTWRMYWHSDAPEDTITDFGFSKTGPDTLANGAAPAQCPALSEDHRHGQARHHLPTFLDIPAKPRHHAADDRGRNNLVSPAAGRSRFRLRLCRPGSQENVSASLVRARAKPTRRPAAAAATLTVNRVGRPTR